MQPRDVVEAWLGAFNRHDADRCAELYADDVHFVAGGGREQIDGKMVLTTDLKLAFEHWEKWTITPTRWTCEGDQVVVEMHNYAICGATGKVREAQDVMVFVVRNGKIIEQDLYFDSAATRDANTPSIPVRVLETPNQLTAV